MEIIICAILMVIITVLLLYGNDDYRQGWRNSKFFDEFKESDKTDYDLIDPDK